MAASSEPGNQPIFNSLGNNRPPANNEDFGMRGTVHDALCCAETCGQEKCADAVDGIEGTGFPEDKD